MDLESIAAELDRRAAEVDDAARMVVARARATEWVSTSADAFRDRIEADRVALLRAADDLRAAAAELRRHALTVAERVDGLRALLDSTARLRSLL